MRHHFRTIGRSVLKLLYFELCLNSLCFFCFLSHELTEVEDDTFDGTLATRFIIDFAVTRSSPESCWDRFDIVSEHTVELKWLILNKHKRWFHSSRVKFPLVNMSATCFMVSMYLIWIFGVQIDSIEQPIKSNSVGSGNMSHCRTFYLYNHLDHCFIVFKHIQQSFLIRRVDVWGNKINIFQITLWDGFRFWMLWGVERTSRRFRNGSHRSWWLWFVFPRTATIRSHKSSAVVPSNLNPASKELISDSVELCETEVCFLHIQLLGTNAWLQKRTMFIQKWILNPQDLPQNRSLETVPVCNVWHFPSWQYCLYSHAWWM